MREPPTFHPMVLRHYSLHMKNVLNFILWLIFIFAVTFAALYVLDLVPEEFKRKDASAAAVLPEVPVMESGVEQSDGWVTASDPTADPMRLVIEKISVDTPVFNPLSNQDDILNQNLLRGAVHYPGSGTLKDTSNLFIFGHSTNHTVVSNESYKTFNRLEELNLGDIIRVQSRTDEYIYEITSLSRVSADEALVVFSNKKRMLTLSTCDSFGAKTDRFVVEAEFVKSGSLGSGS